MLNGYLSVAIFFGLILAFAVVSLVGAWVVRPSRPSASKSENYECGAQPIGEAWVQFPVGFYLVALVFLVFDTLAVFLFPWALTMRALGPGGLKVMLGCMIESELGIAQAAQLGSLVDYIDLDGHLLISSQPFSGLGLRDGRLVLSERPGLGVEPSDG